MSRILSLIFLSILWSQSNGQNQFYRDYAYKCPQFWIRNQDSCYRLIKSPAKPREEARQICHASQSELVGINSVDEHAFIVKQLQWQDHQHRKWYTGVKSVAGYWTNEADGLQLANLENAFLPEANDSIYGKDYLVYAYSEGLKRWGLEKVNGWDNHLYICEAPITLLRNLVEDERTYEYGIEISDPLKIPRGPYFITQPVNTVFDTMETNVKDVYLKCYAGGYPTPTYEWFLENYDNDKFYYKKIDPLTNRRYTVSGGVLIINNPKQDTDGGYYHCRATNKYGTIKSESVHLTFGYIREFNTNRAPETGRQHWGMAVHCDPPQYFPTISYYWFRERFKDMLQEDSRIFVSHDGTLYFSSLEMIDQGHYSCQVNGMSSMSGRIGPLFSINVEQKSTAQELKFANEFPKAFPKAPKAGDTVRLECVVFGYPVASYNWTRKNNTPLPRGSKLQSFNRVLLIPNVQVEDQGNYECLAYNERSSVRNSVYLTIQAEPNFTIPLMDKHMDRDGELIWTCEAFGIPDVTYNWLRNGEPLTLWNLPEEDVSRYTIQDNVLTIKQLNEERDAGMYQCSATNQLTTKYSSAQLRVLSLKPNFKKRPMESETYAAEGGNVTINCNPEAAPRPKFTWRKDGAMLGNGGRLTMLENGNLIISPVSRADEGTYVCTANNFHGSDESRGRLIVLRGPRFIEQLPRRIRTAVNYNQTLRCRADVEDLVDIAYIWKHNGREIRDKDMINNPHIVFREGVLDIINITMAEAGDYECIIKSSVGRIATRTEVIVEGPPGPPGGLQVVDKEKRSATIRWIDGAYNGKPITHYKVTARTIWNDTWFTVISGTHAIEIDRYTGRKELRLENLLNPYTTYEFRVQAYNELGYGRPSLPSPQHSTLPDRPTKPVSNVGGGGGKVGDLTITWEPLSRSEQFGPGIYYKIFWRKKGSDTEFTFQNLSEYGNIGKYSKQLPDIKKNYYTEYEVKVQAWNQLGSGPESEIKTIFSAEDMPQIAPQEVHSVGYNSTALNVSWIPVDQSRERMRGKLIGHRIKYWLDDKPEETAVYYLSRHTRPWSLVVGLQPDTYYNVKVMAYNNAGEGPESERFRERTYRKAPQKPPSSVAVYAVNPSTVRVIWRYVQPSTEEEPLQGYKIRVWEVDQDMSQANDTIIPSGHKLEAYIYNLVPGKAYHLRVLAYSYGGDGRMSSPAHTFQMGDNTEFSRSGAAKTIFDAILSLCVLIVLGAFQRVN